MDAFRKLARQSQRLSPTVLREAATALIEKLHLVDGTYLKRAVSFFSISIRNGSSPPRS